MQVCSGVCLPSLGAQPVQKLKVGQEQQLTSPYERQVALVGEQRHPPPHFSAQPLRGKASVCTTLALGRPGRTPGFLLVGVLQGCIMGASKHLTVEVTMRWALEEDTRALSNP